MSGNLHTGAKPQTRQPNHLLRRARLSRLSPSGSGRPMSRQELAEAVNAWLFTQTGRRVNLDSGYIGKLEQGVIRWPCTDYRRSLRAVLDARSDAELGLYIIRRVPPADERYAPWPANQQDPAVQVGAGVQPVVPQGIASPVEVRVIVGVDGSLAVAGAAEGADAVAVTLGTLRVVIVSETVTAGVRWIAERGCTHCPAERAGSRQRVGRRVRLRAGSTRLRA